MKQLERHFAEDIAQIEIGIADRLHIAAAHLTAITFVALSHQVRSWNAAATKSSICNHTAEDTGIVFSNQFLILARFSTARRPPCSRSGRCSLAGPSPATPGNHFSRTGLQRGSRWRYGPC